ncbi:MAG: zinc ribbon domain-containing protein [Phycisphaerae bacterium]|nr:zinc ribbon domain-containing protein [Phycisphaerae bacterium]
MPTYDYRCKSCGHEFEQFQSMTASPIRKCPKCARQMLERLIGTGAAVLFKGSGFYQTDYRSESYKKSADAETKPPTKADSKSETKGESKPEPKAATKAEPKGDNPAPARTKRRAKKPGDAP